jgi:hypothetical protein
MRFDDDRIWSHRVIQIGADCPRRMLGSLELPGMRFSCARGGATRRRP